MRPRGPYVGFHEVIGKSTIRTTERDCDKSHDRGNTSSIMSAELRPATAR